MSAPVPRARIAPDHQAAPAWIEPDIYGQYLEHVEDCIYPGVWDDGIRTDVVQAARRLRVPTVRWPGGCFADVYHWEDGVGPDRPLRRNQHWGGTESNRFGTDEFLRWSEAIGASPYLNVNLGTGTLDEALRWLDYCNGTEPTPQVLARRANGREEPWHVRRWGIGNETWGSWEAGHTDAENYGRTLANWARFFRTYDPELRIVGVGSRAGQDPHWDRTVLRHAAGQIDELSIHLYGASIDDPRGQHPLGTISTPAYLEQQLASFVRLVREVTAGRRGGPVRVAIDEWNIRHFRPDPAGKGYLLDRASPRRFADAMFAAGVFHAMIRHADAVSLANYVFLVNGHGLIAARDHPAEPTALFDVFRHYRRYLVGERIALTCEGPTIDMPVVSVEHPGYPVDDTVLPDVLPVIDAVAARASGGDVHLAVLNRHPEQHVQLRLDGIDSSGGLATAELDAAGGIGAFEPTSAPVQLPPMSLTLLRASPRSSG